MRLALPAASYPQPENVVQFFRQLNERLRQLPGVRAAGAARALPLGSTIGDFGLRVDGYVPPPGSGAKGDWQVATDGYLEAMRERVVRGRDFSESDTSDSQLVALVNEEMVRRYWNGRDPIGGRLRVGGSDERPWVTVVGVVADVKHNGITGVVKEKFYVPHTQWHKSLGNPIRGMTLVIRTDIDPARLTSQVRQTIKTMDPNLPIADVRTMNDVVGATLSTPRFTGVLLTAFAVLALTLSAIGIYGVLSYLVSRRTREIGIRVAIGARRADVIRLIMRSGLLLALTGVLVGLGLAAWTAQFLRGLLHGVSALDPATFGVVAVVLTIVATIASLVPALGAMRVDPVIALKAE
jgi:putative ABC transport system permease protein